jgi:hypothetical protein
MPAASDRNPALLFLPWAGVVSVFTPPVHRQALWAARLLARRDLGLHRQVLEVQREDNRRQRELARRILQRERERTRWALEEWRRERDRCRVAATEYLVVWAQAREDGRRLLRFLERHPALLRLVGASLRPATARRAA